MKDKVKVWFKQNRGDAGIGFIIAIAASVVIAAFILIPGVSDFADGVITSMSTWWGDVASDIFGTSRPS